ncbi:MAG: CPBP family intramembrane metalloprotease, partial [Cloacibacterium sp.]|nr:CPBP family intramembrane metalloprotease [Cloacibacterium sp.]
FFYISLIFVLKFLVIYISKNNNKYYSNNLDIGFIENNIILFILVVILVPIIETILFQTLPTFIYNLIGPFSTIKETLIIVVISLFFSISHNYNITYVLVTFIVGFSLIVLSFLLLKLKKNYFFPIFFIHATNNLIVFIIGFYN